MTGNEQTPEELAASVGEGSAADFVMAWAYVVLEERNWVLAMQTATPELRLAAAQQFVDGARQAGLPEVTSWDRDVLANELAAVNTRNPCWGSYAEAMLGSFDAFRGRRLAAGTRPRPIDIDHQRVVLIDYDNSRYATRVISGQEMKVREAEELIEGWPLVVRRERDVWVLASFGEELPRPGWPPFLG